MKEDLFTAFESTTKEEWLAKITKDLKGKELDSLNWKINDALKISPFAAVEDAVVTPEILKEYNPDWQVGERYVVEDVKTANKNILNGLMNGVTAPVLVFVKMPSQELFDQLFEGIQVEYIATHFELSNDIDYAEFYQLWVNLLRARKLDSTFACFDFVDWEDATRADQMKVIADSNADYSCETIHINAVPFYAGDENVMAELNQTIAKANQCFTVFTKLGLKAEDIAKQLYFTVAIGKSYLLEIAKLRALKLRYVALLKQWDVPASLPFVKVVFHESAYGTDKHDNLINATTLTMAAVCGGASHIVVTPSDRDESSLRLARNVQLILKHESGFDRQADPAAGSYYLELLTDKLL